MKNPKLLVIRIGKRFGFLVYLMLIGFLGASSLLAVGILMWTLGLFVIPLAIVDSRLRLKMKEDLALPRWAWAWDDTEDDEIRGRPQAPLVWTFDISWPFATFLYLQFYNPLANLRARLKREIGR